MSTSSIRLNPPLISAAEREGVMQKRSTPKQIEFWADLGRAAERVLDLADVYAVMQGLKRLKIEDVESVSVEAAEVFAHLEKRTEDGRLSNEAATSAVYYEASKCHPGLLDRKDAATG